MINGYKFIRFGFYSKALKKYRDSVNKLYNSQYDIIICTNQEPYMVVIKDNEVVSCLWLTKNGDEKEFSIITHKNHRRLGFAELMIKEMINDMFNKKIKGELYCQPVNRNIYKLIRRYKFIPEYKGSTYWVYEL